MGKGENTRQRVLEEAARQAARKGLSVVSLNDVAEAVGLSKSGLFKHFDSKEAMQLAILDRVTEGFSDFLLASTRDAAPGRPRVEAIFERWLEWCDSEWTESGCPIHTFSIELDDQPGPLQDHLREKLGLFRSYMIHAFQKLGDPALSEGEAMAAYFQMKSFILGYADARRMMGDTDARRSVRAAFTALLDRTGRQAA